MKRHRSLILATVLGLGFAVSTPPAQAGLTARDRAAIKADVTSWSAVAGPLGATPQTGTPHTISWTNIGADSKTMYDFFEVTNIGNTTLNQQDLIVGSVPRTGPHVIVTLDLCIAGDWNPLDNSCSSANTVTLGSTFSGSILTNHQLAVGNSLSVRASTADIKPAASHTTQVSVQVTRAQVRPGLSKES